MTMVYATPDQLEALSMATTIAVIAEGRIVQSGSPDDLYDAPDNRFVASLIGSPAMNLVPAIRSEAAAGGVALDFLELPSGPWSEALGAFPKGSELLFGFRPQDIQPKREPPTGPTFTATVHLIEPLGDITVLDLISHDQPFKMVLPEDQALAYRPGDHVEVAFRLEHTHVFARDTGVAIR